MSRNGILIAVAVVLAATAAGVLVWTNYFPFGSSVSLAPNELASGAPGATNVRAGNEEELMAAITQQASSGGFAATFNEVDFPQWVVSESHRLERFKIGGSGTILARLSSANPLLPPVKLDGIYIEIPKEFADFANGKKIEVGVVARAATANPASSFAMVYFTRKVGNSGWLKFQLGAEFELKTFEFDVPAEQEGYPEGPVIAIYGDVSGESKGVEMLGIYVKIKS